MRIRVVGAGVMGRGIAQWAATGGHTVELADARPESVTAAIGFVRDLLDRSVAKGRTTPQSAHAVLDRIVGIESPTAPVSSDVELDVVVEAIVEDVDVKASLFSELEKTLGADTIFASNTSSLPITRIGARLSDPTRLCGLHFFNPVPLMKIAEVVPGAATRPDVVDTLAELVAASGHRAVVVADTPGFLVNHAGRGLVTEALALVEERVAGPAELDRIARDVLGLRMGPFELMDLTGLDVTATVIDSIWEGFRYDDRLRASYLTPNRVAAGLHGRKTGRGWYSYGENGERADEPVSSGTADRPVWTPEQHRDRLTDAGIVVERGDDPTDDALVLVPTWGTTVAEAVAEAGLPASRTVGVDPLSLGEQRRVVAVTPATDARTAEDARAVLAAGAAPASLVRDAAGSPAQRLLASIVAVATGIAERGIATPDDIDAAVTAGLGYPVGPLAWGDRIGAAELLTLQRNLHRSTGDPRYRPTRWLTERAQLGLPLTTPATGLVAD